MNPQLTRYRLPCFLLILIFLTACGRAPADARQQAAVQADQATQAAQLVRTAIARASLTPTPTATPAPTETPVPPTLTATRAVLTATPLARLELYAHPEIPDYVFQVDPARWQPDPGGETADLVHRTLKGCRVESVPGRGLGPPERLLWQDWGRYRWQVMDYGSWAYAVPAAGAGLKEGQGAFLYLGGYGARACRTEQETLLANLLPRDEAAGLAFFEPFPSPTPRPALEGFACPDTPPARLRVGDEVAIITNGLWLRSEPRVDTSTRLRQFKSSPPYLVRVVGGPVCGTYVYWQVEVSAFGEAGETLQGWLAEGDLKEYYLQAVQ